MTDVHGFLEALSSAEPTPGGGSVAALQTAMAASLVAMVANLTVGRKKYADVEEHVVRIRAAAGAARQAAEALITADSDAYGAVSAAMSLPRGTADEQAQRRERIQAALKEAAAPPLDTMRVAITVVQLAEDLSGIGNRSAISDVGTAALCAWSGYEAARLNVEINVHAVHDQGWVEAVRAELAQMEDPAESMRRTLDLTHALIAGTDV